MELSRQAKNSIDLYRGGDTTKIAMLLQMQKKSIVDELMQHFKTSSIHELAYKLSIG